MKKVKMRDKRKKLRFRGEEVVRGVVVLLEASAACVIARSGKRAVWKGNTKALPCWLKRGTLGEELCRGKNNVSDNLPKRSWRPSAERTGKRHQRFNRGIRGIMGYR